MTDLKQRAISIALENVPVTGAFEVSIDRIHAALLAAREEGLEEAETVARGWVDWDDPGISVVAVSNDIADAIRTLKERK